ncbi:unnamed protein product [Nezara viridula]|uniref:Uncharacterized protein n=1 Tax=Nezara viridula TaxID=85310 RepID=A0A9P0HHK4_NEZVI|nr:unnamed protein product [Nezara viridula]
MDWYPREHVRKRGRPPTDLDKEVKKTCGGAAWKRVALERKGKVGQTNNRLSFGVTVRLAAINWTLHPHRLIYVYPDV